MTEKFRSVSIGGSSAISGPTLISCPISSSPSPSGPNFTLISSNPTNITNTINIPGYMTNDNDSDHIQQDLIGQSDTSSIMNASQISAASNDSVSLTKTNLNFTHNLTGNSTCRFPKLEECAHFHYERVQLGSLGVRLADDKTDYLNCSIASQSIGGDDGSTCLGQKIFNPLQCSFIIKVICSRSEPFLIKRSFENVRMLDEMLHRCVYDRKISGLRDLSHIELKTEDDVEYVVAKYLERFSKIASDSLTCGTVLTWFQIDNKGRRLPLADIDTMRSINTPAVGAAYGVRRYTAQACDEISIEVGDMISVIDMPSPAESIWWRGKKSHLQKSHYEVGFFPQNCVATIGDKVPRHFPLPAPLVGQLDVITPTKPVLRKHGKLIAFFRSFILSRPSRRRLKQSGIYKERVFSCDLSEHLLNSGQEIPMVLKCCAEFIEENGIIDGIYRLSGITSNIQKLRRAFDEERIPELLHPEIKQDIHAVSSLLKMYFRELPNPLCTYQLYENFVEAIQTKSDSNERLRLMKETVLKLPPPHYRTLKYLAQHLNRISRHSANTGMTDKNLAIVWAPNLLRSPALESGGVAALRGVGVQAVVTEYLIRNCTLIFDPNDDLNRSGCEQRLDSLSDCESLLVEQREHDVSLPLVERPKSLSAGGPKLISLEEAQERQSRSDAFDPNKSIPINPSTANIGSYIEVGGGPSSLPDKYHTVLPVPRSWQKRKTHSWKSLFTRQSRNLNSNNDIKGLNASSPVQKHIEYQLPFTEEKDNQTSVIPLSIQSQHKPKSIDLYDGKSIDNCVRSNSIDSLRTAGHSRSVSHDSYFDLLQSPLRGVTTCPSRELSELGLNFDREEPEMRIFSESESLVSSPKVGKENIPPVRRVMRARPEEFCSTTNSINPSPKKQPRLNILTPTDTKNWNNVIEEAHNDESCRKRYKLEDQLSDIQFIDCSTPEHTILNSNTLYTSVQVHNPPVSKSNSLTDDNECMKKDIKTATDPNFNKQNRNDTIRYSHPGLQLGGKRKENDQALKERFSYPGFNNESNPRDKRYMCRMSETKITNDDDKRVEQEKQRGNISQKIEILNPKSRYSYCDPSNSTKDTITSVGYILRSNSVDLTKNKNEVEQPKLSVATPSTPIQSPRYSLLVGDTTSSENSSVVNTPIYEMEILSNTENTTQSDDISHESCISPHKINNTKEFICLGSDDSDSNQGSQISNVTSEKRDISAVKRELSLDLEGSGSKMSIDLTDVSASSINKQIINIPSSPNNSNFTHTSDNTSQSSQSPSEFGYQHLNRQSNVVSLENSPRFDTYENFENSFLNYEKTNTAVPPNLITKTKQLSPIKATISITYNVKSPVRKTFATIDDKIKSPCHEKDLLLTTENCKKQLLETSFDENIVYEQVKFFRSSVSQVNQLLNNGNNELINLKSSNISDKNNQQVVPNFSLNLKCCGTEVNSNLIVSNDSTAKNSFNDADILMTYNDDSLEIDQNISLYENIELKKPANIYENIDIKSSTKQKNSTKIEDNKLKDEGTNLILNKGQTKKLVDTLLHSKSNFSVKQLATKFETSPVEQTSPFDFSIRNSKKLETASNRESPCYMRAKNNKQYNKTSQITRSLDENAFIREFGHKKYEDITKSAQQIENINNFRRKSFEFSQPKLLNPPKRLPDLHNETSSNNCQVSGNSIECKLNLDIDELKELSDIKSDIKITPTNENRISLIQNNVVEKNTDDIKNSGFKLLSGCKLDRDRIERIKEERRHQLNEKYRTESFKSKSKIELREFIKEEKIQHSESLRYKSKSRGDVRSLQKDIENYKNDTQTDFIPNFCNRVHRKSDEKNQNNFDQFISNKSNITTNLNNGEKIIPQKPERKSLELARDRGGSSQIIPSSRKSINSTREKISPQFSIRDVTAMFESRAQNQ